jgi:membrane-associated phospholipid phosphatase
VSPSSPSAPAAPASRAQVQVLAARFGPPVLGLALLLILLAFTPTRDFSPGYDFPRERLAHHLGHKINAAFVALSLGLIIIPALIGVWKSSRLKESAWAHSVWLWRVFDSILLDFFFVDVAGKRTFTSLHRPDAPDRPGFPSGHATFAFVLAWLIWRRYPRLGPLWFGIAGAIAWSRVEVMAHFPYQVVGGALFGMLIGALVTTRETGVLLPRVLLSDSALRKRLGAKG